MKYNELTTINELNLVVKCCKTIFYHACEFLLFILKNKIKKITLMAGKVMGRFVPSLKKVIWVWNSWGVNKRWQIFSFWVNNSFKTSYFFGLSIWILNHGGQIHLSISTPCQFQFAHMHAYIRETHHFGRLVQIITGQDLQRAGSDQSLGIVHSCT